MLPAHFWRVEMTVAKYLSVNAPPGRAGAKTPAKGAPRLGAFISAWVARRRECTLRDARLRFHLQKLRADETGLRDAMDREALRMGR
jgi:hypothetical protein